VFYAPLATQSSRGNYRGAARRRRVVAYQTAEKQRPLGCCFSALRLAAFAVKRPPTVRLVRDVRWAGAGVFTPPLRVFDWGIMRRLAVSHGV
jgi:hypothetical protein